MLSMSHTDASGDKSSAISYFSMNMSTILLFMEILSKFFFYRFHCEVNSTFISSFLNTRQNNCRQLAHENLSCTPEVNINSLGKRLVDFILIDYGENNKINFSCCKISTSKNLNYQLQILTLMIMRVNFDFYLTQIKNKQYKYNNTSNLLFCYTLMQYTPNHHIQKRLKRIS